MSSTARAGVLGARVEQFPPPTPRPLSATPFILRDPSLIPKRQWLYGRHLIRKFISLTVAPGGLGKTAMKTVEGLAMATGRDLLKVGATPKLRVWWYNLEDPADEIERRIAGACLHYNIRAEDIAGRLFSDSGRDQPLTIAEGLPSGGGRILKPIADALVDELLEKQIDVLFVDPFVSCHTVSENDNGAMDLVAKEWGRIADRANCSIELIHHSRKLYGLDATAESSRGGIALVAASRSTMVLNRMGEEEANKLGIEPAERRRLFRAYADKNNLSPPMETSDWYRLASVDLTNGDWIGVVERYEIPDLFRDVSSDDLAAVQAAVGAGEYRESAQAADWVGKAVADVMALDISDTSARKAIAGMVKTWIGNGSLKVIERPDSKRMVRKYVVAGNRAEIATATLEKVGRGKVGQRGTEPLPHHHTPLRGGVGGAGQDNERQEGATPSVAPAGSMNE